MARRPVALVAAIVLFLEAFGIAFVNLILGKVADNQNMSMAGLEPSAISTGSWVAGVSSAPICCSVRSSRCAPGSRTGRPAASAGSS